MKLPTRDEIFLNERGFAWEVLPDADGGCCVVIKDFDVSGGGFAPDKTELMVRIPGQYPLTPLDMWYCDPPIRVSSTGQFAQASDVMESHIGRTWQRFSRHLNGSWRPNVDSLRSFFTFIQKELQGAGKSQ